MISHQPNPSTHIETDGIPHALPLYRARPSGLYRSYLKRILDITFILMCLPLVVPLIAFLAATVALDGGKPFYSQLRIGKDGKHFRLWKLRTMVENADELLESYLLENAAARDEWNATQKLKNDPRITALGRFLRKTSIDELPQLWNVLGDTMSLVGPRPMMVNQKQYYHGQSYYELLPGITGLWQVSDRNESAFVARVSYDETYNRTLSLKTDFNILKQTVGVVIRSTGY
jgi:exopolysaccharide production protein ExoY